jgi:hypothetical protein
VECSFLEKLHVLRLRYSANSLCGATFHWEGTADGAAGAVDTNCVTSPLCGVRCRVQCKVVQQHGRACGEAMAGVESLARLLAVPVSAIIGDDRQADRRI